MLEQTQKHLHFFWSTKQPSDGISKAALLESNKNTDIHIEPTHKLLAPTKLEHVFSEHNEVLTAIPDTTSNGPQEFLIPQNNGMAVKSKEGSGWLKIIAYFLLFLGAISILGKIFGNS